HWMHVPFDEAEMVKIQYGHAQHRAVSMTETFVVQPFGEGMPTEVQRQELAEVIEYRAIELFEFVQREIKRSGYHGLLRAGAVITGGSSQLPGIREIAQATLGLPVRMAKPERMTGMADALRSPAYSTSVGLLGLGLEMDVAESGSLPNGQSPSGIKLGNLLGGFFRRLLPE
ncbi:MAG: rod shape-determining protein, partial [Anaerolineae bacterium]|nr:rod shape-determining protein [Anaerolineae bacterium]